MNRVLKRPMFRIGGSAGTGITSGLDTPKRGLVDGPGKYSQPDVFSVIPTADEVSRFKGMFPQFQTPQGQGLSRFLMSTGLNLLAQPGGQNIFQSVATAAKGPTGKLFEDIDTQRATQFATDADVFKTLIEAKGEALSGMADSKTYSQLEIGKQIQADILKIASLQKQLTNPKLTSEEKGKLNLDLKATQANLNFLRKENPLVDNLLKNKTLSEGFINSIMLELSQDKEKYPRGLSDPKLYEDAVKAFQSRLEALASGSERTTQAEGGRAEFMKGGGADMDQMPATEEPKIDYETLRARLPKEISDDIVRLLVASPQALEDFATIATQSDVDMFNQNYSVNLTLPQEA